MTTHSVPHPLVMAECIIQAASLTVAEERLQADPELRQAMIGHFRREALRYAAQENPGDEAT